MDFLRTCRIDLGAGYAITALFGVAMVIIGSTIEIEGRGASLLVRLSEQLVEPLGQPGKWLFLIGAAGAVFSSLLGVWQAVPYGRADWVGERFQNRLATVVVLLATLVFFLWIGWRTVFG